MNKYNTFLAFFISSVIAFVVFMVFYLKGIFGFAVMMQDHVNARLNPFEVFSAIFSTPLLVSLACLIITSLTCRILGIIAAAKSKTISDGEKAMWIIGFVIMGFITSIVYLVMAKGKKFAE